jgi:hypothetical protein
MNSISFLINRLETVANNPRYSTKARASARRDADGYRGAAAFHHLTVCPPSCTDKHVMCDFPSCASVGQHLASDHVYKRGVR